MGQLFAVAGGTPQLSATRGGGNGADGATAAVWPPVSVGSLGCAMARQPGGRGGAACPFDAGAAYVPVGGVTHIQGLDLGQAAGVAPGATGALMGGAVDVLHIGGVMSVAVARLQQEDFGAVTGGNMTGNPVRPGNIGSCRGFVPMMTSSSLAELQALLGDILLVVSSEVVK